MVNHNCGYKQTNARWQQIKGYPKAVKKSFAFLAGLYLCLLSGTGYTETRYVIDVIRVDLRTGPSMDHRIIDFLKSGTAMKIIKTGPDSKWTQVKLTRNGKDKQGWIQSQYLSAKPVAKTK